METNSILNIKDLTFKVGNKSLIEDINIDINKNSFVGIMGPNGSGKSTLLKNIYRQHKPSNGAIYINDRSIDTFNNKEYARFVGVVNQEQNYSFDFKVTEILKMANYSKQSLFSSPSDDDDSKIREALEMMGLLHLEDRSFLSLSGGEKQRILIARAIVQDTSILVLDEPTNHLDIKYKLNIMERLSKLDKTIVAAIHDFDIAINYCDYIVMLKDGYVVKKGHPSIVLTQENIKDVFDVDSHRFVNPINNKISIMLYT